MKLTREQLIGQAEKAWNLTINNGTFLDSLEKFAKSLGVEIEEPFPEYKVDRGSMWQLPCGSRLVLVGNCRGVQGIWPSENGLLASDYAALRSHSQVSAQLQRDRAKYIGQFNFAAGLPKL